MYDPKEFHDASFIDDAEILATLEEAKELVKDKNYVRSILEKAGTCKGLTHREAAVLLEITDPELEAELYSLAKEIKERYPKKDIWVYTGYERASVCDLELMDYTDVVVDGRFILAQRDVTLEWKGSPNQRVIDVKKTRARGEVVLFGEK